MYSGLDSDLVCGWVLVVMFSCGFCVKDVFEIFIAFTTLFLI